MKTAIGNISTYLSVVIWSAIWAFAAQCENVPLLLLTGSIAVVWGGIAVLEEIGRGQGAGSFKVSGGACLFEAFGSNGFRLMVIPAVLMIDPIDAANLSNVWIGAAIVLGLLVLGQQLSVRHAVGSLCFAAGILVMALDGVGFGHGLALCGGLIWGWYLARSLVRAGDGRQADAIGNLVVGAGLIYLSLLVETPWNMAARDLYWMCGLIFAENIGYVLWRYGARYGDQRKAKISVLFLPVVAVVWICFLGGVRPDAGHIWATAAVTMAGLILSPHVFRAVKMARS